jgi:hypothetical protein
MVTHDETNQMRRKRRTELTEKKLNSSGGFAAPLVTGG